MDQSIINVMTSLSHTLLALATAFLLSSSFIIKTEAARLPAASPASYNYITPSISPQAKTSKETTTEELATARTSTNKLYAALIQATIHDAASKAIKGRATAARLTYSIRHVAMRHYLGACRTAYSEAISSLHKAETVIKTSKDKVDIMMHLFDAVTSIGSCEDGFREVSGMRFPLKRVNSKLMVLVRNSLAMGSKLSRDIYM